MSIPYGGMEQVLSGDLQELTDHSNKFITSMNDDTTKYDGNGIAAFDPFEEGASTANIGYRYNDQMMQNQVSAVDDLGEESSGDREYHELMPDNSHTVSFSNQDDVTERIRSIYFALMYLMSHPSELSLGGSNALCQDDEEADNKEMIQKRRLIQDVLPEFEDIPLQRIIFAEDAEVVLPQAHTASQLFGLEQRDGIELEAAVGIDSICELFRRWLAIMPGGDHFHVIDPPGVIVMRISGGRYRVTAAHRVVWKWMNDFLPEDTPGFTSDGTLSFVFGDLVTMTIIDVFETDETGKLLSYCPTFDNRSVKKTYHTTEQIRRQSSKMKGKLHEVSKSKAVTGANKSLIKGYTHAMKIAGKVRNDIEEKMNKSITSEDGNNDPISPSSTPTKSVWLKHRNEKKKEAEKDDAEAFERALSAVGAASIADTNSDGFGVRIESPKPEIVPSPQTTSSKRSNSNTTSGSFTTVYEC